MLSDLELFQELKFHRDEVRRMAYHLLTHKPSGTRDVIRLWGVDVPVVGLKPHDTETGFLPRDVHPDQHHDAALSVTGALTLFEYLYRLLSSPHHAIAFPTSESDARYQHTLRQLVAAANRRLKSETKGEYSIVHSERNGMTTWSLR